MRRPDAIVIDGRAYSWRVLLELRRRQLEEWRTARARQPALFEVRHDTRPAPERSAAERYREPTLLSILDGAGG